jgi:hypothetical protein
VHSGFDQQHPVAFHTFFSAPVHFLKSCLQEGVQNIDLDIDSKIGLKELKFISKKDLLLGQGYKTDYTLKIVWQ